jgi:hypothetical protein
LVTKGVTGQDDEDHLMAYEIEANEGEISWVQVAAANGPTEAGMIVEYLRAEGIRAVAWQEGAGNALGLYMGSLGTARVMVPEEDAEEALALLEEEDEPLGSGDDETDDEDSASGLTKAVLGATAVIVNPIGAGIAVGLSYFMGSDTEKVEGRTIDCRICGTNLELSPEEVNQGWYVCPECESTVHLVVLSRCPVCQTELELDEAEIAQRWYRCSECNELVQLQ